MISSYISDDEVNKVFDSLDLLEDYTVDEIEEVVREAEADLHRGVAERFTIPLVAAGGPFESAPSFSKTTVASAMKAMIRKVLADENFKSSDENQTTSYRDLYYKKANKYVKDLMNPKIDYKLKLSPVSDDYQPVQIVGIASPDY